MLGTVAPPENYFLIDGTWELYECFLEAIGERRIRVTFDGTMIELMTPSNRHEYLKSVLGMLLECYMETQEIEFEPGGNTTFKRVLKKKGLEPDECYWIRSWREVLGGWDEENGPPPDLCLEVEVSRSVLDRVAIYEALGVPELWRVSEQGRIRVLSLQDGSYTEVAGSQAFPDLDLQLIHAYLDKAGEWPSSKIVREFRKELTSR